MGRQPFILFRTATIRIGFFLCVFGLIDFLAVKCNEHWGQHPNSFSPIVFSPDGKLIASDCHGWGIWLWDLSRPNPKCRKLTACEDRLIDVNHPIQFADATTLVFLDSPFRHRDRPPEVVFWDIPTDKRLRGVPLPYRPDVCALSGEGNVAIISPKDYDSSPGPEPGAEWPLVDLRSGKVTGAIPVGFDEDGGSGRTAEFSRNGKRLIVHMLNRGRGWCSEVWDVETRTRLLHRNSSVSSISDDGQTVALASWYTFDHEVWRLDEPRMILSRGPMSYPGLRLFPDGNSFVVGRFSLEVWNLEHRWKTAEIELPEGYENFDRVVSPDGSTIAACGRQEGLAGVGKIFVWDIKNPKQRRELQ